MIIMITLAIFIPMSGNKVVPRGTNYNPGAFARVRAIEENTHSKTQQQNNKNNAT
jgi:hypothetical protein